MLARSAREFLSAPRLPRVAALTIGYYEIGIAVALSLGVLVRAIQVFGADFPLNDGGLFYQMVRDLQANHYIPPATTTYNHTGIPYAYSPLAFYVAGFADDLSPFSLLTLFRLLPLLFTCLTLVAFWRLARTMLTSDMAVVAALAAFALIPRSFIWLVMGGGITRSLGLLFAILALEQIYRMYRRADTRTVVLASVFSAACVLSHLQTGWFLAYSAALMWAFLGRDRVGVRASLFVAAGVIALTSPWWLTVVSEHGVEPFVAANSTGGTVFSNDATRTSSLLSIARAISTSEPFFPLIAALGLLGAVLCFASNRFLLPAWWVAIILLDVRAFATYASLPIGLLAGVAVAEGLVPLLQRPSRLIPGKEGATWLSAPGRAEAPRRGWVAHARPLFVLGCLLYYAAFAAMVKEPGLGELTSLDTLTAGEREAMQWIAASTPEDARFLVIPGDSWETGKESEWFPALTGRTSVATVQGLEWVPDNAFGEGIEAYFAAWGCGFGNAECLDDWANRWDRPFDYVYLPARDGSLCCGGLEASLAGDPRYLRVYDGAGGVVFERRRFS
ncbi:MAG: hypothetical protein ACM3S1_03275 [Hyphomicrobiales bacterium]